MLIKTEVKLKQINSITAHTFQWSNDDLVIAKSPTNIFLCFEFVDFFNLP